MSAFHLHQPRRRRIWNAATLVLLVASSGPIPGGGALAQEPPARVRGDVSRDGSIDSRDALGILSALVGKSLPEGYALMPDGDADTNGAITVSDALDVLLFTAGVVAEGSAVGDTISTESPLAVSRPSFGIHVGDTSVLSVEVPAVWTSSDTAIAVVVTRADARLADVIGRAPGMALVTVHAQDDPSRVGRSRVSVLSPAAAGTYSGVTFEASVACATVSGSARSACWGGAPPIGVRAGSAPTFLAGAVVLDHVRANPAFACGLDAEGDVWCWGENGSKQLGLSGMPAGSLCTGTPSSHLGTCYEPIENGVTGAYQLDLSDSGACALVLGAGAYCWGAWPLAEPLAPAIVPGTETLITLSAGVAHACGLDAQGVAYCWGRNSGGQLGDGSGTARATAAAVAAPEAFVDISAGEHHTCAIGTSGTAYCWGSAGTIGDSTSVGKPTPTAVHGSHVFTRVSAAEGDTCAIDSSANLLCWGHNGSSNEFGEPDASPGPRLAPTPAGHGMQFAEIALGATAACGLTLAGESYCWGDHALMRSAAGVYNQGPALVLDPAPAPRIDSLDVEPARQVVLQSEYGRAAARAYDPDGFPYQDVLLNWSSSDTAIAKLSNTVSAGGFVLAGTLTGTATLTARGLGVERSIEVVVEPAAASVEVLPDSIQIALGGTTLLRAVVTGDDGSLLEQPVTWSGGMGQVGRTMVQVATVDSMGLVTALAPGSAPIDALTGSGISDRAIVTVYGPPATISIDPADTALYLGTTGLLQAIARDRVGNRIPGLRPQWTSSDPAVVTVNGAGRITAYRVGTAYIEARVGDIVDTARVRVPEPAVTIEITPDSTALFTDYERQLYSVLKGANDLPVESRPVYWTSSDTTILTVSAAGMIRGVRSGYATVTALSVDGATASLGLFVTDPPPVQLTLWNSDGHEYRIRVGGQEHVLTTELGSAPPCGATAPGGATTVLLPASQAGQFVDVWSPDSVMTSWSGNRHVRGVGQEAVQVDAGECLLVNIYTSLPYTQWDQFAEFYLIDILPEGGTPGTGTLSEYPYITLAVSGTLPTGQEYAATGEFVACAEFVAGGIASGPVRGEVWRNAPWPGGTSYYSVRIDLANGSNWIAGDSHQVSIRALASGCGSGRYLVFEPVSASVTIPAGWYPPQFSWTRPAR